MEQIALCLDQLETQGHKMAHTAEGLRVLRLVGELRVRLHEFVEGEIDDYRLLLEQRDDLLRQLEQICREPV